MDLPESLLEILRTNNFTISTDTRKDLTGSVYFALSGENFDGNKFVTAALEKGALAAVSNDPKNAGEHIFIVDDVLETLHAVARLYRQSFTIPVICIGGSNGKTISKELLRDVLAKKYIVHATKENFNNHIGVPLAILDMKKDMEIGVFEIGANHPHEHTRLLNILAPTHVVVTNNGMDHLEGFGTPEGSRNANKELYDWAKENDAKVFVHHKHQDLIEDSVGSDRIIYPTISPNTSLSVISGTPVTFILENKTYATNLVGEYNVDNIELALSLGNFFGVDTQSALEAICTYEPISKRSQYLTKNGINFIVDCYNANPTSMHLAIESFVKSSASHKGLILGDMLELGSYTLNEHQKIVEYVRTKAFDRVIYVGNNFKTALGKDTAEDTAIELREPRWFPDSAAAREWFIRKQTEDFTGFTFLLKGSRGVKIEKIIE